MAIGIDPHHRGSADAVGFSVFVLRDPRDGVVFCVGWTGTGSGTVEKVEGIGSSEAACRARRRAIDDGGCEVERLVVATELMDEAEAITVKRAVTAAYEAARQASSGMVTVPGRPGRGSSAGSLLGDDAFDDPDVRQFVAQAAAEIDRLSSALSHAEQGHPGAASEGFLDGDHRGRLEGLILQQESEIAELNAALDRVRALRDLSQWAARTAGDDDAAGTIRVADLNRSLG